MSDSKKADQQSPASLPENDTYRFAKEFHRHADRPVDTAIETSTLRAFRDQNGVLRAGLYPSQQVQRADDLPLTESH